MHIHVGGRTMASCRTKSVVQRRVQGNNNPTMHEMVLDAIGRCKDPTGMIPISLMYHVMYTSIICSSNAFSTAQLSYAGVLRTTIF